MTLLKDYKKAVHPFEMYLQNIHAREYMGTDDDMPDAFESWIVELEAEDLITHANAFSKFLISNIK